MKYLKKKFKIFNFFLNFKIIIIIGLLDLFETIFGTFLLFENVYSHFSFLTTKTRKIIICKFCKYKLENSILNINLNKNFENCL